MNPLVQRYMRPLEDGSCPHREVELALIAAVVSALASRDPLPAGACRAGCAVWPEAGFEVYPSSLLIGEHCEELEGRNCALAHVPIVHNSLEGVK